MSKLVLRVAHRLLPEVKQEVAAYWDHVKELNDEGYRADRCIHGTSMWTDYDPICGPCEDGDTGDPYVWSLIRARAKVKLMKERSKVAVPVISRADMPRELKDALADWVLDAAAP